jgi:tripartite ATP-independent transporter DctM subunit
MSDWGVGAIGLGILFTVIMLGMPIAMALGIVGFAGIMYLAGPKTGLEILGSVPFHRVANWTLICIPMFVLMGNFAAQTGISQSAFDTGRKWLGHFRGGLGLATVFACGLFAAVSGSSIAEAAIMGRVCLPELNRHGYDKKFSAGCVAAAGTLGILIPPSVIMVIYGTLTEQSIGKLLMAGLVPGILLMSAFMVTVAILAKINPRISPSVPRVPFKEMLRATKGLGGVFILFLIVIVGLWTGFFTPTEAAGIGAFAAFVFSLATRTLTWKSLTESLMDTGRFTAMIFLIVVGAMLFMYFLAMSGLPVAMSEFVTRAGMSPLMVIFSIMVIYLILGCILDTLGMVLLTVPTFYPIIVSIGFDPIWCGVIVVLACEIGLITPPVGLNVFVVKGVAEDVPMQGIFQGIVPFLIADLVVVAIVVAFPIIALWIPSMM